MCSKDVANQGGDGDVSFVTLTFKFGDSRLARYDERRSRSLAGPPPPNTLDVQRLTAFATHSTHHSRELGEIKTTIPSIDEVIHSNAATINRESSTVSACYRSTIASSERGGRSPDLS